MNLLAIDLDRLEAHKPGHGFEAAGKTKASTHIGPVQPVAVKMAVGTP
jgi:hypothetical protein